MLLQNFLKHSAARLPNKTALICGSERLTYQEINDRADSLALFLRDQDINRQDRVAIFLDNSVESVVSLFGILKADAVFLMLSPTLKAQKLAYILNDCQVKAIITHVSKSAVVLEALSHSNYIEKVIWVGPEARIPAGIKGSIKSFAFNETLDEQSAKSKEHSVQGREHRAEGIGYSVSSPSLSAMSYQLSANLQHSVSPNESLSPSALC